MKNPSQEAARMSPYGLLQRKSGSVTDNSQRIPAERLKAEK
jgi:hypothetical protein